MKGLFFMKAMVSVLKQRGPAVRRARCQSPVPGNFLLPAEEQQFWRSHGPLVWSTTSILLLALTPPELLVSMSTPVTRCTHTVEMTCGSITFTASLKNNPGHRKQNKKPEDTDPVHARSQQGGRRSSYAPPLLGRSRGRAGAGPWPWPRAGGIWMWESEGQARSPHSQGSGSMPGEGGQHEP